MRLLWRRVGNEGFALKNQLIHSWITGLSWEWVCFKSQFGFVSWIGDARCHLRTLQSQPIICPSPDVVPNLPAFRTMSQINLYFFL